MQIAVNRLCSKQIENANSFRFRRRKNQEMASCKEKILQILMEVRFLLAKLNV